MKQQQQKRASHFCIFFVSSLQIQEANTAPAWTLSQYTIFIAALKTPLRVVLALSESISSFSSKLLPGSLLVLGRDPCLDDCYLRSCVSVSA